MPYQNRVDPWGRLHSVEYKGELMGNRGRLHSNDKTITKRFQGKRWISCSLEHKDITREIMNPRSYTELFFLDEATAFSAGHRPCGQCRPERLKEFKEFWFAANSNIPHKDGSVDSLDRFVHEERLELLSGKEYKHRVCDLPDGTFIEKDRGAYLVWGGELFKWSFAGYGATEANVMAGTYVKVITPMSIVRSFLQGFVPDRK